MPDMSWMTRSYKITVSRAKLFCFLGLTSLTIAFLIFLMMMLILVQLHGEHTLEVAQELLLTHPNCQLCFDVSSKIQSHVDSVLVTKSGRVSPRSRHKALAFVKKSLLRDVCGAQTALKPSSQQIECHSFLAMHTETVVEAAVLAYSLVECRRHEIKISPPPLWDGEVDLWRGLQWLLYISGAARRSDEVLEEEYQASVAHCRKIAQDAAAAAAEGKPVTPSVKSADPFDVALSVTRPPKVSDFCWDLCFEEPLRMGASGTRLVDKLFLFVVRMRATPAIGKLIVGLIKYGGTGFLLGVIFMFLVIILKLKYSESVAVYREVVQLVMRGEPLRFNPTPQQQQQSQPPQPPQPRPNEATSLDAERKKV
jgi:hypothetical protein